MRPIDTLNLPGSLAERVRSLDLASLRRGWRLMVLDHASDPDPSLADLIEALEVVHERLVLGIEPNERVATRPRKRRAERPDPAAITALDRVVAASLAEFPHLDASAVRARARLGTDIGLFRRVAIRLAREAGASWGRIGARLGCNPQYAYFLNRSPEPVGFEEKFRRAKERMEGRDATER